MLEAHHDEVRVRVRARVRVRVRARGSRKRFATECSKPIMTKPEMHGHMPRILPGQS